MRLLQICLLIVVLALICKRRAKSKKASEDDPLSHREDNSTDPNEGSVINTCSTGAQGGSNTQILMPIVAKASDLSAKAAPGNGRMLPGMAIAACQQHLRGTRMAISPIPAPCASMLQRGGGKAPFPLPHSPSSLPKEIPTRVFPPRPRLCR